MKSEQTAQATVDHAGVQESGKYCCGISSLICNMYASVHHQQNVVVVQYCSNRYHSHT